MASKKTEIFNQEQRRLIYKSILLEWEGRLDIARKICKNVSSLVFIDQCQSNINPSFNFRVNEKFTFSFNRDLVESYGFTLRTSKFDLFEEGFSHFLGSFFNCSNEFQKEIDFSKFEQDDLKILQDLFLLVSLFLGRLFLFLPSIEVPNKEFYKSDVGYLCQLSGLPETRFYECQSLFKTLVGISCLVNYEKGFSPFQFNFNEEKYESSADVTRKNMANPCLKVKTNVLARDFYKPVDYSEVVDVSYYETSFVEYAVSNRIALKEEFRKNYNPRFAIRAIKRLINLSGYKTFLKTLKHPALKFVNSQGATSKLVRNIYSLGYMKKNDKVTKGEVVHDITINGLKSLYPYYSDKLDLEDLKVIDELLAQCPLELVLDRAVDIGSIRLYENYKKTDSLLAEYKPEEHAYKKFLKEFQITVDRYVKRIEFNKYRIFSLNEEYRATQYFKENNNSVRSRKSLLDYPIILWLSERMDFLVQLEKFLAPDHRKNHIYHKIRNWYPGTFKEIEEILELDISVRPEAWQKMEVLFLSILNEAMNEALTRISLRDKVRSPDTLSAIECIREAFYKTSKYREPLTVQSRLYDNMDSERRDEDKEETVKDVLSFEVNEVHRRVLSILNLNPTATQGEIAEMLKVSKKTVQRRVEELSENKILAREGSKKSGAWVINKNLVDCQILN